MSEKKGKSPSGFGPSLSGAEGAQFQPEPPPLLPFHETLSGFAEGSPKPAKSKAVTVLGQHRGRDTGFAASA